MYDDQAHQQPVAFACVLPSHVLSSHSVGQLETTVALPLVAWYGVETRVSISD